MRLTADTTVSVTGSELLVVTLGVLLVVLIQVATLIDVARRRRWVWIALVLFAFPFGTLAWLLYGRRREVHPVGPAK